MLAIDFGVSEPLGNCLSLSQCLLGLLGQAIGIHSRSVPPRCCGATTKSRFQLVDSVKKVNDEPQSRVVEGQTRAKSLDPECSCYLGWGKPQLVIATGFGIEEA